MKEMVQKSCNCLLSTETHLSWSRGTVVLLQLLEYIMLPNAGSIEFMRAFLISYKYFTNILTIPTRACSRQEFTSMLNGLVSYVLCSPVQDVADSCRTGAATNVIFGLALGYKSVIIPIFAIAIAIYISFSLAAMYGIAVAALGMLSTIATGLAIDAYGPISDNAGGIAEMAGMSHRIRERTDALDAAGNTTAAIGKVNINPCDMSKFSGTQHE